MRRDRALALLSECTGDDIWSPEHCRLRGIPEAWIDELAEAYESGFRADRETIYEGGQVTNQYHGIRDVFLAIKLGEVLGVDAHSIEQQHGRPARIVAAIKDAVFEG
ncbi:hypothetical protein [Roseimaritima sediminicola]|uniref:hypothetical protein n=1 Tax=Roseimaritima sediminicola TaxID=2662066 RepID=UPI001298505F|nr:hypothetical protein [Roseimaritima sediminicola]